MLDKDISYDNIKLFIEETQKQNLHSVELFDIYRGSDLGDAKYSMALRLVWQMPDQSEKAFAVDTAFDDIINSVVEKFSATVRGK